MSHSVPLVKARSGKEIEEIAFKLVEAFQPNAVKMIVPFEVEQFFEFELKNQTGVEPVYRPLGGGLDGYTDTEMMECVICSELADYGEDDVQRRRLRATQAHEIGHCHLHVGEALRNRTTFKFLQDKSASFERYRQAEIKAYVNPEWQAWRFAGALLMPECCIRAAVNKDWTRKRMSWAFDVNPSFIDVRMRDLKIAKKIRPG